MDLSLGPWKAEKTVDVDLRQPLLNVMGDEAWDVVTKSAGFTPQKAPDGKPPGKGFSISGVLTNVLKQGRSYQVVAKFNVWVDGAMSNVATLDGRAEGSGRHGAEDALRALTESRMQTLLGAIKAGRVAKLR